MKLITHKYTPPETPSVNSFAAFLRANNLGWMGNNLVDCGLIRSEQVLPYPRNIRKRTWNNATDWWKFDEPVLIDWDKIRAACQNPENKDIRNFGKKKLYLLGVYFGICTLSHCPFCGKKTKATITNKKQ
jgi:hypothetical protein